MTAHLMNRKLVFKVSLLCVMIVAITTLHAESNAEKTPEYYFELGNEYLHGKGVKKNYSCI